jgi:hypothetical protein
MSKTGIVALPDKGIKVDVSSIASLFRQEIKDKVVKYQTEGIGTIF